RGPRGGSPAIVRPGAARPDSDPRRSPPAAARHGRPPAPRAGGSTLRRRKVGESPTPAPPRRDRAPPPPPRASPDRRRREPRPGRGDRLRSAPAEPQIPPAPSREPLPAITAPARG